MRRLGFLQIDTVRAIEAPQYLILWSRLGNYDAAGLDRLLREERKLFEWRAFIYPICRSSAPGCSGSCGPAALRATRRCERGVLHVNAVHWEPDAPRDVPVRETLAELARWLGARDVALP